MIEVLKAKKEDIQFIADNMREGDKNEIWAAHRLTPYEALEHSLEVSTLAWTLVKDFNYPVAMFGVSPLEKPGHGSPWLLGTDLIDLVKTYFLRNSKTYMYKMQEKYPCLMNLVDARNTKSIEWLRWCGFEFYPPVNFGVDNIPFLPFELKGKTYAGNDTKE